MWRQVQSLTVWSQASSHSLRWSNSTGWGSGSVRPFSIGSSMDYKLWVWKVSLTVTWSQNCWPFVACAAKSLFSLLPVCFTVAKCSAGFTDVAATASTQAKWSLAEWLYKLLCSCLYATQKKKKKLWHLQQEWHWFVFQLFIWPYGRPFDKSVRFRQFSVLRIICL